MIRNLGENSDEISYIRGVNTSEIGLNEFMYLFVKIILVNVIILRNKYLKNLNNYFNI